MINPEAALNNYAEHFGVPEWFDEQEAAKQLEYRPRFNPKSLYRVAGSLGLAQAWGNLPADITTVFEFGSGNGEGLLALSMMLSDQLAVKIVGSDLHPGIARQNAYSIRNVKTVHTDGIAALETPYPGYDLVVANMFGPTHLKTDSKPSVDPTLIPRFLPLAFQRLNPDGVIAVNSCRWTMDYLQGWLGANLDPSLVSEVHVNDLPKGFSEVPTPHMFIKKPARVDTAA